MQPFPTWVEIDLDALEANLRTIAAAAPGARILLTVKADAYGHGAVQIAGAAASRVDRFGVATVDEALELRRAGIERPVLILSPVLDEEIGAVVDNDIETTVSSLGFARRLAEHATAANTRASVHVELDTGMGRTGALADEAEEWIRCLSKLPGLEIVGLFTHFAVSDSDEKLTRRQLDEFREWLSRLDFADRDPPILHSANGAAVWTVPEAHLDMIRPGLVAYGCTPGDLTPPSGIEPVLAWKARIVQIRHLPAGSTISYGGTYTAPRGLRMGVLPVGYGHGYPFRLSNRGEVLVRGRRAPVIGRVTMDMTMVDLTDIDPAPVVGDEVVLVGRQGEDRIRVDDVAGWAGSLSYEVLCGVGKRVPRMYIRDGEVESVKSLLGVRPNGTKR